MVLGLVHIRVRGCDRRVPRAQFGGRGLEGRARRQAREDLGHAVLAPRDHRRRQMMRARHDIRDNLRRHRIRHRGFENTDDRPYPRAVATVQPHPLPDHAWIGVKRPAPEPIRQHYRACGVRPIVGCRQQPSQHWAQPHHFEVVAIHHTRRNLPRRAQPHHREIDRRKRPQLRDRLQSLAQVLNLRNGKPRVLIADSRHALP